MSLYPPVPQAAPSAPGWQRPQLGSTQAHPGYESKPTNVLAFWSLLATASAWILTGPLGTIAGGILGFLALKQVRERGEGGRELAVISLVFAGLSIIMGILLVIGVFVMINSFASAWP